MEWWQAQSVGIGYRCRHWPAHRIRQQQDPTRTWGGPCPSRVRSACQARGKAGRHFSHNSLAWHASAWEQTGHDSIRTGINHPRVVASHRKPRACTRPRHHQHFGTRSVSGQCGGGRQNLKAPRVHAETRQHGDPHGYLLLNDCRQSAISSMSTEGRPALSPCIGCAARVTMQARANGGPSCRPRAGRLHALQSCVIR